MTDTEETRAMPEGSEFDETNTEFIFNWHTLDERDDMEGFLHWMIVNLTVPERDSDGQKIDSEFDNLSEITNGFQNTALTIQINGVPVNPWHFVMSMRDNMVHWAKKAAVDELKDRTDVSALFDQTYALQRAIQHRTREVARAMGLADYIDRDD